MADKGYSGKNTDRPKFQELVRDIKRGLIAKVVVYKLDRISRSILDFANMMELFQQYNVEFVSSTEKFDTSTPMGRAMLNICIVFAQLERETIQKRVTDAYYVNVKIAELDGRKQKLVKRIADLTVEAISPEQVSQISGYLDTWDSVSFDDKRRVVDLMITTIAATSDSLNITWKI